MKKTWWTAVLVSACALATTGGVASAQQGGVRDVDWHNAEFTVPPVGSCPWQPVRFAAGHAETADSAYRFAPGREIVFADVTGEGVEDALVVMQCGPHDSEYSTALIGMTTDAAGAPVPLGTVSNPGVWTRTPADFTVWHGDIAVWVTDWDTEQSRTEYYRWASSAKAFVRVDGQ